MKIKNKNKEVPQSKKDKENNLFLQTAICQSLVLSQKEKVFLLICQENQQEVRSGEDLLIEKQQYSKHQSN